MARTEQSTDGLVRAASAAPAVGNRFVVVSLVLAGLLLIPGLLGRFGTDVIAPDSAYGAALATLAAALDDIRFGSGLRFWLGVGGAGAMALLLLYPVRKALAGRRFLGSIAGWFKVHLLIGIFAPVAILYHTNFSTGGLNANVALWAMLAVAISGILGHFVYAKASAAYYGDKQAARRSLDGALSLITSLGAASGPRDQLAARLEAFDAGQLAPRSGIRAAWAARRHVTQAKRTLVLDAVTVVDQAARELRLAAPLHAETRVQVAKLLHAYFAFAGRAASRSVREQLWARWRMFHLPLFLVMCVATGLHVAAVWDMDGPAAPIEPMLKPTAPQAATPSSAKQVAGAIAIQQVRRPSVSISGSGPADAPTVTAAAQQPRSAPTPAPVQTAPAQTAPKPVAPAATPRPVAPKTDAVAQPMPQTIPQPAQQPPRALPAAAPTPPAPPPAVAVVTSPPRQAGKPDAVQQLYDQVQKVTETEPQRMALGATRSLADQIEAFKAKQRSREFKHSDAETGFALTGKHTRADCTDCHTKPFKEERAENPRQCIACHKKDDVHKGRRPACVDCHTTNSFRDRSKRRN